MTPDRDRLLRTVAGEVLHARELGRDEYKAAHVAAEALQTGLTIKDYAAALRLVTHLERDAQANNGPVQ